MMQFETVKTFILWILVGVSLLLTFALWSYTPDNEILQEVVEESADLGGEEETLRNLIDPASIIFKSGSNYFGFSDPANRQSLFEDIQSWSLYDFRTTNSNGPPSEEEMVEIIFPEAVPMELAGTLFTFNDEENFPEWRFDRLFITFNQNSNTLNVIFLSENGEQQATAVVNNSERYSVLWQYLTTFEGLSEYVRVEGERPIYIPRNPVDISSVSIAVQPINSQLMVDALFSDPDIVNRNRVRENELYITDSARGIMRVYLDRRTVEFQDPLQSTYELMEPEVLLDQSVKHINDHRGWTDEYKLMEIDINATTNKVRYQMYYEGYPVFGNNFSSIIEQQYRAMELYQYNRPLFEMENFLGEDTVSELISGNELITNLQNSTDYNLDNVGDIKIGYDLTYQSSADAITLSPAWYMEYNDSWQKVDLQREGTEDAMEAN